MIPSIEDRALLLYCERLESRLNLTSYGFDATERLTLDFSDSSTSIRLRGPGAGTVEVDEATNSLSIDLQGTNSRSTLQVTTKGESSRLTGLDSSALRLFKTRNVTTEDATLTFNEGINRIQINDVHRTQINIAETNWIDDVTITMGAATDLNVDSGQIIRLARADSILNTDGEQDVIEAAAIQRLRVKDQMQADLVANNWIAALPKSVRRSIQWAADHEEGTLYDWHQGGGENAGGGIFNTGGDDVEAVVSTVVAHSGVYSAKATITGAYLEANGNRAVRLMRWTDVPWDQGGDIFESPSYFSTWMYIPENYDPETQAENGGWWNVFQFKSDDADGVSQSMFSVNIGVNGEGEMVPYLWAAQLESSVTAAPDVTIPSGEWIHFEAYYKSSPDDRGRVTIYQNGQQIIDRNRVQTVMPGGDESVVWGVGNYTNHIEGGEVPGQATIYFDDALVSTTRVSRFHSDSLDLE